MEHGVEVIRLDGTSPRRCCVAGYVAKKKLDAMDLGVELGATDRGIELDAVHHGVDPVNVYQSAARVPPSLFAPSSASPPPPAHRAPLPSPARRVPRPSPYSARVPRPGPRCCSLRPRRAGRPRVRALAPAFPPAAGFVVEGAGSRLRRRLAVTGQGAGGFPSSGGHEPEAPLPCVRPLQRRDVSFFLKLVILVYIIIELLIYLEYLVN